jgi:hypothetical protein
MARTAATKTLHRGHLSFCVSLSLLLSCTTKARADEERAQTAAAYTGFRWGIAPGLLVSLKGAGAAFSVSGYAGYGVDTGTVVVVPGLSLSAVFPKEGTILNATPHVQLVYPVSILAPFIQVGAGPAYYTPPGKVALTASAGGGLVVHASPGFAIGAAVSYYRVFGTDVAGISVSPILALAF